MPIRAYVLVEADTGRGNEILEHMEQFPELVQADRVTGPYDVIGVFESDDLDKLGDLVRDRVHDIPGVHRTMSCLRFTM